jgi:beta-galactosidase
MQYHEGRGMVVFCQLDVNGRTETEPAAEALVRNIVQYVANWKPAPARTAVYAGDDAGRRHLESTGVKAGSYDGGKLSPDQLLVVGPGGARELTANKTSIAEWLKAGGRMLALGLDQENADALLPARVSFKKAEHIATFFEPNGANSFFQGIGPSDLHNRDPRQLSLIASGAAVIGDGVLATADNGSVIFDQLVPWEFDPTKQANLKRTFRRASFTLSRLLANSGVAGITPILARFNTPVDVANNEKRWLNGLYLDQPEEWDDPYRHFRW